MNEIGPGCGWAGAEWDALARESEANAARIREIDNPPVQDALVGEHGEIQHTMFDYLGKGEQ